MTLKKQNFNFCKKKQTLSEQVRGGYRLLIFFVVALNVFLGSLLLYIGSFNTAQGYILQKLQIENEGLYNNAKVLDAEIIKVKTFDKILQTPKFHTMNPPQEAAFIKGNVVAVKELEEIKN